MLNKDKHLDIEQLTEEVLNTPPEFSLPDNFADVVAKKAARRFALEEYINEFFTYAAVAVGLSATLGALAFFLFESGWDRLFRFVSANTGFVTGIAVLLLFVLFADKVLLRYCFYRYADK